MTLTERGSMGWKQKQHVDTHPPHRTHFVSSKVSFRRLVSHQGFFRRSAATMAGSDEVLAAPPVIVQANAPDTHEKLSLYYNKSYILSAITWFSDHLNTWLGVTPDASLWRWVPEENGQPARWTEFFPVSLSA